MDIADCYRVLGLTSIATAQEIKRSYRQLARQWHPDVNPNNQHAHDMFIRVTEAYKVLLTVAPSPKPSVAAAPATSPRSARPPQPATSQAPYSSGSQSTARTQSARSHATHASQRASKSSSYYRQSVTSEQPTQQAAQDVSDQDPSYEVKLRAYEQLQSFLRMKRYPRAVALIEALSQKLPQDPEIRQWQAIIYQRWGRQLITERKYNQARAYLKKAYTTDPNNKSLLNEIERDLKAIKLSV